MRWQEPPEPGYVPEEWQCHARKVTGGLRRLPTSQRPFICKRPRAVKYNSPYCSKHGGHNTKTRNVHFGEHMPLFYSSRLTKTLEARLVEMEGHENDELQLREELHLTRVAAGEVVERFGQALELKELANDDATKAKAADLVELAGSAMCDVLKDVQEACLNATKVEALMAGKFSPRTMRTIIAQIVKIAWLCCGEEHQDIAERMERMIHEEIKVDEGSTGTFLTPDKDVLDMDATIPNAPVDL